MTIHHRSDRVLVWQGDCIDLMRELDDGSIDAVVTDPPYALEFMGKVWDRFDKGDAPGSFQHWCEMWGREALRILKPGGHLLAFGGTRTFHRLTAGIEDAGFEIRDSIAWLYGSGFPKSLDVSKAIDKQLGAQGTYGAPKSAAHAGWIERGRMRGADSEGHDGWQRPSTNDPVAVDQRARQYEGGTEQARDWQGWGTALKPAFEPIVVARKPLAGTVASNVLAHGTGALNIDASRIGTDWATDPNARGWQGGNSKHEGTVNFGAGGKERVAQPHEGGRWPANVVLDESQATALDTQSGVLTSGANPTRRGADTDRTAYGSFGGQSDANPQRGTDSGGASRFFYVTKAPKKERPAVEGSDLHPTVKPLALMRWLVKLVTPPGGIVLDPFGGSGTTAEAALLEGFRCMIMEREAGYLPLIMHRIERVGQ